MPITLGDIFDSFFDEQDEKEASKHRIIVWNEEDDSCFTVEGIELDEEGDLRLKMGESL